jgi:aryl carrier-like protein
MSAGYYISVCKNIWQPYGAATTMASMRMKEENKMIVAFCDKAAGGQLFELRNMRLEFESTLQNWKNAVGDFVAARSDYAEEPDAQLDDAVAALLDDEVLEMNTSDKGKPITIRLKWTRKVYFAWCCTLLLHATWKLILCLLKHDAFHDDGACLAFEIRPPERGDRYYQNVLGTAYEKMYEGLFELLSDESEGVADPLEYGMKLLSYGPLGTFDPPLTREMTGGWLLSRRMDVLRMELMRCGDAVAQVVKLLSGGMDGIMYEMQQPADFLVAQMMYGYAQNRDDNPLPQPVLLQFDWATPTLLRIIRTFSDANRATLQSEIAAVLEIVNKPIVEEVEVPEEDIKPEAPLLHFGIDSVGPLEWYEYHDVTEDARVAFACARLSELAQMIVADNENDEEDSEEDDDADNGDEDAFQAAWDTGFGMTDQTGKPLAKFKHRFELDYLREFEAANYDTNVHPASIDTGIVPGPASHPGSFKLTETIKRRVESHNRVRRLFNVLAKMPNSKTVAAETMIGQLDQHANILGTQLFGQRVADVRNMSNDTVSIESALRVLRRQRTEAIVCIAETLRVIGALGHVAIDISRMTGALSTEAKDMVSLITQKSVSNALEQRFGQLVRVLDVLLRPKRRSKGTHEDALLKEMSEHAVPFADDDDMAELLWQTVHSEGEISPPVYPSDGNVLWYNLYRTDVKRIKGNVSLLDVAAAANVISLLTAAAEYIETVTDVDDDATIADYVLDSLRLGVGYEMVLDLSPLHGQAPANEFLERIQLGRNNELTLAAVSNPGDDTFEWLRSVTSKVRRLAEDTPAKRDAVMQAYEVGITT